MANIILNFEGDLTINVNCGCPFAEDCERDGGFTIEIPTDENDLPITALYAEPGEDVELMTLPGAMERASETTQLNMMEAFPVYDLYYAFDTRCVFADDEGDAVYTGPMIIFKFFDGDILPLSDSEIDSVQMLLKENTFVMIRNGTTFFAYCFD